MNELESRLHYPLGDTLPDPGATIEVAPGVRWIRMSLPFVLNHINLWLLRDRIDGREGWTIVDCCIAHDDSRAQWERIFADELQGLPVLRVIVTHMHPDHIGLADWLCRRWGVRLWISATDYNMARLGALGPTAFGGEAAAAYFASHGLNDADSVARIKARSAYYPSLVPAVPPRYRRMMDGDGIAIGGREWRCISGHGHAPEHISLYCDALHLLIGGDMMLPRISSNVSVYETEPEADALRLFLASIDKFRPLPEDTLTLPSHGKPFTGLHERIEQLHAHHRDRLQEVIDACGQGPCTAAEVMPVMFKRPLDLHQKTFAMGEVVAHLNYLWLQRRLERSLDADGLYRFRLAAAA